MFFALGQIVDKLLFLFGYITTGKSFPNPLSKEEETECVIKMGEGDEEAKNKLIEHNLRLVAHISKKYAGTCKIDTDDLISIGTIGLIKGVSSYDLSKKTSVASYVSRCIENEILMTLRKNKRTRNEVYLEDSVGTDKEGNSICLADMIGGSDEDVAERIEMDMMIKYLNSILDEKLSDREKQILKMRFGLNNSKNMTQNEIAKILGISRSYVSRIEKTAVDILRAEFEKANMK